MIFRNEKIHPISEAHPWDVKKEKQGRSEYKSERSSEKMPS